MSQPIAINALDPPPQPPEPPLASDCCDSGCTSCVHDVYSEELAAYRQALAAWKLRHPDANARAGSLAT
ncbi:oxidoreductase-like domain-containing protein [Thermomonas paludicola]|uniref:oxidoreductase-like domain-containing protein n=1 Tax=Thermomonas paludicola TaxID=2884874 RepID=UPI00211559AE|nr:oxidoreductase-like domain-containing protein [Thermomonas paludicola]